nr:leucine-rich repeat serine/threonine-protein kinase 2-like isoform X2 [Styela clava]
MIQDSDGNANLLCLQEDGIYNEYDQKDFTTYIANSFVTILLYYHNEVIIFQPASDVLITLLKCFPSLKPILGQSGVYHNLVRIMEQHYIGLSSKDKKSASNDTIQSIRIEFCCLQLLLEMTRDCSANIVKCAEVDIMYIIANNLQVKSTSFQLHAVALELLSCLIGKGRKSDHYNYLRCVWRQQCLVQELPLSAGKSSSHKLESSLLITILKLMNSLLIDSDTVQVFGLKCLYVLMEINGAYELLWTEGAFDTTLHAIFHYFTCKEIQLWGSMVLKMLLFKSICFEESESLPTILLSKYEMLIHVLSCSLASYSHCADILISVCEIIKAVIFISGDLTLNMINAGIPKDLIQIFADVDKNNKISFYDDEEDIKNHVLSTIRLFTSNPKHCESIASSHLSSSHNPVVISCLQFLGGDILAKRTEGETSLLMKACSTSQICLVDCMLHLEHLLFLHGIKKINLDDIKACLRYIFTMDTRDSIVIGLLLRFLFHHGEQNIVDWKRLNMKELSQRSLKIAYTPMSEETHRIHCEYSSNPVKSGFKLSLHILNAVWTPENCTTELVEILENKYFDAVDVLSESAANKLTTNNWMEPMFECCCSCIQNKKSIDGEDKKVNFCDHLHISFDDEKPFTFESNFDVIDAIEDNNEHSLCEMCHGILNSVNISGKTCLSTDLFDDHRDSRNVTRMDISYNDLKSLTFLSQMDQCRLTLSNLESFICGHNVLTHIPCSMTELMKNVREMKLDHCCLSQFPISILIHCHQLVLLDVSCNAIDDCWENFNFHSTIAHQNLSTLKMSGNKICQFPYKLCSALKILKILDLSHNEIKVLPELDSGKDIFISDTLNLSNNSIESISLSFMMKLAATKHLNLSKNNITTITEDLSEKRNAIMSFSIINLSHNKLNCFPSCLIGFKSLKTINLSYNVISSFPDLSTVTAMLVDLDLSNNKIFNIEDFLKSVTRYWSNCLRAFKIGNNHLVSVPADIGMLKNLEVLDLQNNLLTHVPNDIGKLSKLYHLSLLGNKLDIDNNILTGRTQNLLQYFFSRLKKSDERLKQAIILIGYPSEWRTAFLQYLTDIYGLKAVKSSFTEGEIQIFNWSLSTDTRCFNISLCDVNIKDDSIYKSYPQLTFCDCALYIVFCTKDSDEETLKTLKAAQSFAPYCPVLCADLRGNGSELNSMLSGKSPGCPDYIRHLKFDSNLPDSADVEKIVTCISSLLEDYKVKGVPMFVNPVPKNYIDLEAMILELRHKLYNFPVVSYSSLIDAIQNHQQLRLNLEDGEELLSAIHFLTKVGVIWHQNDPRDGLRNYFILNPLWLLDLFQKVFNSVEQMLENNVSTFPKYIVHTSIIKEVIGDIFTKESSNATNVSSSSERRFISALLRLMQNRGLIFLINNDQYFVPYFQDESPNHGFMEENIHRNNSYRFLQLDYVPVNFWHHINAGLLTIYSDSLSSKASSVIYCWKNGISLRVNECLVFLLREPDPAEMTSFKTVASDSRPIIEIVVSNNEKYKVIPLVIDHIQNTIEEWFPDLMDFDIQGKQRFVQYIPCALCIADRNKNTEEEESYVHFYEFSELSRVSEPGFEDNVKICPAHSQQPLDELVPGIFLKDFNQKYALDPSDIAFQQEPEDLLGEGGFGTVFKGKCKQTDVAIKLLRSVSSNPAYMNLRTELNVLARLHHPSIIKLIGYILSSNKSHPTPLLIMELATGNCLTKYIQHFKNVSVNEALIIFPRFMRLRVLLQILEGIEYMHRHNIVYRDLKPDNVLIMTMDENNPMNVKLVDFGIALSITPAGTIGGCGSPGYSAPEVVALKMTRNGIWRIIPYTNKCDIFSFGLVAYEVCVCRTPWFLQACTIQGMSLPSNVPDEAILKGVIPSSLTTFDVNLRWPHMQSIISRCLKRNPEDRPTAQQLLDSIRHPEICCYRNRINIGNANVAAVSQYQVTSSDQQSIDEAVCHIKILSSQSSGNLVHLEDDRSKNSVKVTSVVAGSVNLMEQTTYQIDGRNITSLLLIPDGQGMINKNPNSGDTRTLKFLAGTADGKLMLITEQNSIFVLSNLWNRIECLHLLNYADDSFVALGLSNGCINLFTLEQIINQQCRRPHSILDLSLYCNSRIVQCLTSGDDGLLYACCVRHIVCIKIKKKGSLVIKKMKLIPKSHSGKSGIKHISICNGILYASSSNVFISYFDLERRFCVSCVQYGLGKYTAK